ncbi:MAG: hypothetical protein IBJ09_03145 [Bacteroidia bacterium]|nr:hypothetical protein [Bacteroidia bacterium]
MKKDSAKKTADNNNFFEEYKKIVPDFSKTNQGKEWNSPGDRFVKLSIYKKYSPVKITDSTTLIR